MQSNRGFPIRRTSAMIVLTSAVLSGWAGSPPAGDGQPPRHSWPVVAAIGAEPSRPAPRADRDGPPIIPPKPFAAWPRPAAALVITGEQIGYLEPCGCTKGQIGGLGRRDALVQDLKVRKWPLVLVDLGDTIRSSGLESQIKYTVTLQALQMMGYSALALGPRDMKLDFNSFLGLAVNHQEGTRIIAGNLLDKSFQPFIPTHVMAAAGPLKVGVTTIVSPSIHQEIRDNPAAGVQWQPPDAVLPGIIREMMAEKPQVVVLLAQATLPEARRLAKANPGFIVVSRSDYDDPVGQPELVGPSLVVTVGRKGKYAGVLAIYPTGKPRFRYQRVTLDDTYRATPRMKRLIESDQAGGLLDQLKTQQVVEKYPKRKYVRDGLTLQFVGSEKCQECHPGTYDHWRSTPHSRAYKDLLPRGRQVDAECVLCHTTGFTYVTGFVSPARTPQLEGNGCENCHGPGSLHVEHSRSKKYRSMMRANAARNTERLCQGCHDADNDPHFDFKKYWPKIDHSGLN